MAVKPFLDLLENEFREYVYTYRYILDGRLGMILGLADLEGSTCYKAPAPELLMRAVYLSRLGPQGLGGDSGGIQLLCKWVYNKMVLFLTPWSVGIKQ